MATLRSVALVALFSCSLGGCRKTPELPPLPEPEPRLYTPKWAFQPWISKDISDRADTESFVAGFLERDIPVGVVVLDSPWETDYNTFVPNPDRYPGFEEMLDELTAQDIRLVLWVTQMVNTESFDLEQGGDTYPGPSPNYVEALDNDYFVNDGNTYFWWKGYGSGVDFFNPDAVAWWRAQQDELLDMGISGWKLDFGEQYIDEQPIRTAAGEKTLQEYSEAYYEDFLQYGLRKRGPEDFVTMVRAYDESYGFTPRFYARPEHSPVLWMGDNFRNWEGLEDALDHAFRSADAGYVVIGSDIGGYLDRNSTESIPFDTENFIRWTAVSGLMPFFQLHGRANLEPWAIPEEARRDETVFAYRYWATLHHELVPFFYSQTQRAYQDGPNLMRPVGGEASWAGDYRFQVGDAFLVAPILDETGVRDVTLPDDADWYDWFAPGGDPIAGGTTLTAYDTVESYRVPVFVREGAIVPAEIDNGYTGIADEWAAGALTILVWPGDETSTFELHQDDYTVDTLTAEPGSFSASRLRSETLLRVRLDAEPASVSKGGAALAAGAGPSALVADEWAWDDVAKVAWVRLPASDGEVTVSFAP